MFLVKRIFLFMLVAFLSHGVVASVTHAGNQEKQKVVYHVNVDNGKVLNTALKTIQNHLNAVGVDNLDLRVVVHGAGITLLQLANNDPAFQDKVKSLKRQGVHFIVCNSTLTSRKIDFKKDLYDVSEADIVPSGVAKIAHLQSQGFSYVKP